VIATPTASLALSAWSGAKRRLGLRRLAAAFLLIHQEAGVHQ
jgi:hypothetical protein